MSDRILPERQSFRLKGFDYKTLGAYFVTLCTDLRLCTLGQVLDAKMHLSPLGSMVDETLNGLAGYYKDVSVVEHVVMPNHVHALISLDGPETLALPEIMQRFKSFTAKSYRKGLDEKRWPEISKQLWQRNYHESIVRDDEGLKKIRRYILDNPMQWDLDEENPDKS